MPKIYKYNAKALPEGTVRTWGGQQYKKESGDWVKVTRGKSKDKGTKQPQKKQPEKKKFTQDQHNIYGNIINNPETRKKLKAIKSNWDKGLGDRDINHLSIILRSNFKDQVKSEVGWQKEPNYDYNKLAEYISETENLPFQ